VTKTTLSLRLSLIAMLLAVLTHAILLAWLRREIEAVQYVSPVRDMPVIVSLEPVDIKPINQAVSEAPQSPRKLPQARQPAPPTPKKSPAVVQNPPQAVPAEVVTTIDPANPDAMSASPSNQPVAVSPNPDTSSVDPAVSNEADKSKQLQAPLQKPIFPDGPGPLVQSGAFPYSFFFGEYTGGNVLGAGTFFVESGDGEYKLLLTAKASGLTSLLFSGAAYRSEGLFDSAGFRPKIYGEKSNNRTERVATVDYPLGQVNLGEQKRPPLAGMQDRLSVTWQIGLLLKAFPDLAAAGASVPVPLLAPRSLENAQFISQGWVELPRRGDVEGAGSAAGGYKAVHFKFKSANELNKTQIDLWYEPDRLPQPLRVRWIDDRQRTIDILRTD
jgi:Protein of unknown function (DUF3108)